MRYLLCFLLLLGCSRPPIETLKTTIYARSPATGKSGETIPYYCDIEVIVNNLDNTVVIKYSDFEPWWAKQHPSTLEARAKKVVEQQFPHLAPLTIN